MTNLTMARVANTQMPDPDQTDACVTWFWHVFLPGWIDRAHDREFGGFADLLDVNGCVPATAPKTVLAQARLLFTFAHLALLSEKPVYREAAQIAHDSLARFRKPSGLYRRAQGPKGAPLEGAGDIQARSYDQTFVIFGLSTWAKLTGCTKASAEIETLWQAVEAHLLDAKTGMLIDNDGVANRAHPDAPNPAQNPHMHMYEAALQAYEMGQGEVWLGRAKRMRSKGLEYFFDVETCTIAEFIKPDLTPLDGKDGQWREIGHQCEWAWLLQREVDLGGDPAMADVAARLLDFAVRYGFHQTGPLKGAAYDAVSSDTSWREMSFLLWPQTEAIKAYAMQSKAADDAPALRAKMLCDVIFRNYFEGRAGYINQVDPDGMPIWDEALSRLLYHLVLGFTEGARFGLWPAP